MITDAFILLFITIPGAHALSWCSSMLEAIEYNVNTGRSIDLVRARPGWTTAWGARVTENGWSEHGLTVQTNHICTEQETIKILTNAEEFETAAIVSFGELATTLPGRGHKAMSRIPFFRPVDGVRFIDDKLVKLFGLNGTVIRIEASCTVCSYGIDGRNARYMPELVNLLEQLGSGSNELEKITNASQLVNTYGTHYASRTDLGGKYITFIKFPKIRFSSRSIRRFISCASARRYWSRSAFMQGDNKTKFEASYGNQWYARSFWSSTKELWADDCLTMLDPLNNDIATVLQSGQVDIYNHVQYGAPPPNDPSIPWRKHIFSSSGNARAIKYKLEPILRLLEPPVIHEIITQSQLNNGSRNLTEVSASIAKTRATWSMENFCGFSAADNCRHQQCLIGDICPAGHVCLPTDEAVADSYGYFVRCCDSTESVQTDWNRDSNVFSLGHVAVGDTLAIKLKLRVKRLTEHPDSSSWRHVGRTIDDHLAALYLLSQDMTALFGTRRNLTFWYQNDFQERNYWSICGIPGKVNDHKLATDWKTFWPEYVNITAEYATPTSSGREWEDAGRKNHTEYGRRISEAARNVPFIASQEVYMYRKADQRSEYNILVTIRADGIYEIKFSGDRKCVFQNNITSELPMYVVSNPMFEVDTVRKVNVKSCDSPPQSKLKAQATTPTTTPANTGFRTAEHTASLIIGSAVMVVYLSVKHVDLDIIPS